MRQFTSLELNLLPYTLLDRKDLVLTKNHDFQNENSNSITIYNTFCFQFL